MTEAEFETHVKSIKEDGYTVLPGMLTNDECDAGTEELERLVKEKERGGMECVFNKARVFRADLPASGTFAAAPSFSRS